MSLFLLTGAATLDVINTVPHYPEEDEELRAQESRLCAGGNALNSSRVLSALGHRCELLAQIADDIASHQIIHTLDTDGVSYAHCPRTPGATPTSYITLNAQNGSRSIIHYRDLPELSLKHFRSAPIEHFDWLHFEGRNIDETVSMLRHARRHLHDQPISIEIEKDRPGIEKLLPVADLLIFSRSYATTLGFTDPGDFLRDMRARVRRPAMVCSWGEQGAWAITDNNNLLHVPAIQVQRVRDTLGAGDTFNAGLIASLATGSTLEEAVQSAVTLAGRKIGRYGFDHLKQEGRPDSHEKTSAS